ncbi:hypothetical protein Tco_0969234 [Tanacetum coccineum]
MNYLRTTEAELGIDLDRPPSEQDPLDRLNDLANKKRKHAGDIHGFFRANKRLKSSVQYEDHPAGTVLNEPVLGLDDHARTFSSLLLAEIDKRNLNQLKQMRVIEQLRQYSDSEDGDEPQNDTTCLMAIDLDIIDLQKENEELLRFNKDFTKTFEKLLNEKHSLESENSKLLSKSNDLEFKVKKLENNKEVVEPCKKCDVLTKEVDSLKCNISRLHDEALNFSKFKKSSIVLDDMLNRQKLSQDKEGLGFSKIDKTLP